VTNDFFTLADSVPVDLALEDFSLFRWREFEFEILPSPGHTPGSISLLAKIDGRKIAFTGDLIHSPGKVLSLYDLQYNYAATDGVDCAISSLSALQERGPHLICPSHGKPIENPAEALTRLRTRLADWISLYGGPQAKLTVSNSVIPLPSHSLHHLRVCETLSEDRHQVHPVSPHLIASASTLSSFYAIISDSGKALMIDFGCASPNLFFTAVNATRPGDRLRFFPHSLPELQTRYGLKSIDVIMPSHIHDDHIAGFPYLKQHYGAKVYCYENMKGVLEHPWERNLGCVLGEPIQVDRSIGHKESFRWEEYEFVVLHNPGHTEYQMALVGMIDGVRVGFTGDAFLKEGDRIVHDMIYFNQVRTDSHVKSVTNVMEQSPEILAPGHGVPFCVTQQDFEALRAQMLEQSDILADLVGGPHPNLGLDPSWIRLSPYLLKTAPGKTVRLELIVQNYTDSFTDVESALLTPRGWDSQPRVVKLKVPPGESGKAEFTLRIPSSIQALPRTPIVADIAINGQYRGQLAEAVVELEIGRR
jgi:glyoxylase-like metal-dependent hydrolase (beta-lactamase superfamily II)